jgi:hypothetical protein
MQAPRLPHVDITHPGRAHPPRRSRRVWGPVAAVALLAPLAACGDDSPAAEQPPAPATTTPPDSAPPATTTPAGGYEHPLGADEVVVEIVFEGGFLAPADHFRTVPMLLVAGDGRAFTQGPQIEIYPAPLLPNVLVQQFGEDGVQGLVALADEHGLLAEREYERDDRIADAADLVVRISAGGETYEHRAYALGLGGTPDEPGARGELQDFVEAALAMADPAAATFEPDAYVVRAIPIDDLTGFETEPTVVAWPEGTGVALSEATECVEVPADAVGEVFGAANQLTFFTDAGGVATTDAGTSDAEPVVYELAVKPLLPGRGC